MDIFKKKDKGKNEKKKIKNEREVREKRESKKNSNWIKKYIEREMTSL